MWVTNNFLAHYSWLIVLVFFLIVFTCVFWNDVKIGFKMAFKKTFYCPQCDVEMNKIVHHLWECPHCKKLWDDKTGKEAK